MHKALKVSEPPNHIRLFDRNNVFYLSLFKLYNYILQLCWTIKKCYSCCCLFDVKTGPDNVRSFAACEENETFCWVWMQMDHALKALLFSVLCKSFGSFAIQLCSELSPSVCFNYWCSSHPSSSYATSFLVVPLLFILLVIHSNNWSFSQMWITLIAEFHLWSGFAGLLRSKPMYSIT